VFVDVIDVNPVQAMGPQSLIYVVHDFDVRGVGHVGQPQQTFAFLEAFFGQRGGAVLFVQRVVNVLDELGNDFVNPEIFVGGLFGRAGNNQRGAGLVDQD